MDRDQVEAEVRARRQTPEWAEQQAEANGWEPFTKLPVPWSRFDGAGKWPINFATMWLSCPSPDDAATHWGRLQYWAHHVWRDIPSKAWFPAQSKLSEALRKGSVQGWGKKSTDDAEWSAIPQDEWESFLDWSTDRPLATASLDGKQPRWFDVRVAREDVLCLLTADEGAVEDAPVRAGAPTDVDFRPMAEGTQAPEVVALVGAAEVDLSADGMEPPSALTATPEDDPIALLQEEIRRDINEHIPAAKKPDPKRIEAANYLLMQAATGGDPERLRRDAPSESAQIRAAAPITRATYRAALASLKEAGLFNRYYGRQTPPDTDRKKQ